MACRRYVHVFPPVQFYEEAAACLRAAAARTPRISVETWRTWSSDRPEWQDPNAAIVLWSYISLPRILALIPPKRSAVMILRYSESIGEVGKIDPGLSDVLDDFKGKMEIFDAVLVGSPSAADFLRPYCKKVGIEPIGYDPGVMGIPDWSRPKEHDLVFYGAPYGRRKWILPALEKHFGKRMIFVLCRSYGLERKRLCDGCRAILYVGHSDELAFPGFRIWQAIASSAALISESRDMWPMTAEHYVGVPMSKEAEMDAFIGEIEKALQLPLEAIAQRAHADLSKYTIEKSMEYIEAVI